MTDLTFDDELFDAEVVVERLGHSRWYAEDVGEALGMTPNSVRTALGRGGIPQPDHYEDDDKGRAVWTPLQVAQILVERAKRKVNA